MRAVIVLLLVGGVVAGDPPTLVDDLLALVKQQGKGEEQCTREERRIEIAYDAMMYDLHVPDRTGRMQRSHKELGPNLDGAVIEIEISDRPYGGPMELPQRLHGPYYDTHCAEVREGDSYLFVSARFGESFPADLRRRILERIGAARDARPPVPVRVVAKPGRERFKRDEPIVLKVTLTNGLGAGVRFAPRIIRPTEPAASGIHLVDTRRDGKPCAFFVAVSEGHMPADATQRTVPAGGSLDVRIDAREWSLDGGWIPGEYEVAVRVVGIEVDGKVSLSVKSDPVRFTIE